jgi:hypothetical protein
MYCDGSVRLWLWIVTENVISLLYILSREEEEAIVREEERPFARKSTPGRGTREEG